MSEPAQPAPLRMLYAASSSYSGSTLLPFLLVAHPEMAGIGHTGGWHYDDEEEFLCSCGAPLPQCPFFRAVARDQQEAGLPFRFQDFGFEYRLVNNERINGILTASIPRLRSSALERGRDRVVQCVPAWKRKLSVIDDANLTFMRTTLDYFGASIFVSGDQLPHSLRHLRRIPGLDISVLHLVRDMRGVAFSNMTKRGWSARVAAMNWLVQQAAIVRISSEFPPVLRIYYEDMCDETDATLESIHGFVGIEPQRAAGVFNEGEHHILGNQMRLGDGKIVRSRRWESELPAQDRKIVEDVCWKFAREQRGSGISDLVEHYLGG